MRLHTNEPASMVDRDTIVAVATAPGHSARAIVRVSGPGVRDVLRLMSGATPVEFRRGLVASRLQVPSSLVSAELTLPVLLAMFPGPASYTGEDCLEIVVPGNPSVLERCQAVITALPGVRLAGPGEFTARAFFAEKLTLEQAEGIAATIAATTEQQLGSARQLLAGSTGAMFLGWADELTTLLALVEAGIDFTDQEDVVSITPGVLRRRVGAVIGLIASHLGAAQGAEERSTLPVVSLVGLPNAGKSTLFNALLGKERVIASPIAGTTRDVIAETLDLSHDVPGMTDTGATVMLQDLAGLETPTSMSPSGEVDAAAQTRAIEAALRSDVIVWCDPTGRFDAATLPEQVRPRVQPSAASHDPVMVLRLRTFGDRPESTNVSRADLSVCALDGWHLRELRQRLATLAAASRGAAANPACIVPRHRVALRAAMVALQSTLAACEYDADRLTQPELVADGLRAALAAIEELVGKVSVEDVLGKVFSTFCVGK